jgi:peroxiredoxin
MKKLTLALCMAFISTLAINAEVKPGDKAVMFTLKNVNGSNISLTDYNDQKGVILVFTCNACPFAKAYEQRIIKLHENFASLGFPVVAINPNDPDISPEDAFENMKARAGDRNYPYPYLKDEMYEVYRAYGASRTPQVFLLKNNGRDFTVAYIGAIDNNALDASTATEKYVENAIRAVMSGQNPDPAFTQAIGCTIKAKT